MVKRKFVTWFETGDFIFATTKTTRALMGVGRAEGSMKWQNKRCSDCC